MQAAGRLNFRSSVQKHAALLGFSLVAALPFSALAQPMSVPASSGAQMTEPLERKNKITVPQPISDQSFDKLVETVEAELQSVDPLAAGMILERIDPTAIIDPTDFDAFIGLFEKTAEALFSKGQHFPDNAALTKSISLSTKLLTLIDKPREPGRLAFAQIVLGNALTTHGARFGDHPEMDKGIATIRTASKAWSLEASPERWANAQLELAQALIASARISETNEKFDEAIAICQQVIDAQSNERLDLAVTKARSVMSNALWQYGQRQGDISMFSQAVWYAQEALNATDKDLRPFEWATTLNYLANSNREYASYSGDSALLATAIDQYTQSLTIRTRERYPIEWAQTQLDFGNALGRVRQGFGISPDTHPAIQAYKQSLEIRTKEDTPLEWGMSQNNMAATLYSFMRHGSEVVSGDYDDVVKGYRDALEVTTRERAPHDWAMMKANLGSALTRSFDAGSAKRQQDFQQEMDAAMRAQENYPLEKSYEMHQLALERIMSKFNSLGELEEALQISEEILTLYTREKSPWRWVDASRQKVRFLEKITARKNSPKLLKEIIAIYREEQLVVELRYDPLSWAEIEWSVARRLSNLGNLTNDNDKLRQAETAYIQALDAISDKDPDRATKLKIELADLRCHLGKITSDDSLTNAAVAQYQEINNANRLAGKLDYIESIENSIALCNEKPENPPKN
jgi:hypothetical protein